MILKKTGITASHPSPSELTELRGTVKKIEGVHREHLRIYSNSGRIKFKKPARVVVWAAIETEEGEKWAWVKTTRCSSCNPSFSTTEEHVENALSPFRHLLEKEVKIKNKKKWGEEEFWVMEKIF